MMATYKQTTTSLQDHSHVINSSDVINGTWIQVTELPDRLSTVNMTLLQVYTWCLYVIPVLGLVFNLLSIAVFLQRRLSRAAVSNYLIALAVCDIMANSIYFYLGYIRLGFWSISNLGCKLSIYLTGVGRMSAIWIHVFFTIERFISVCFVFKRSFINNKRIAASIIALLLIMLMEQSFILVWQEMAPPYFCIAQNLRTRELYLMTLLVLNRGVNFIIPLIMVSVMNVYIVRAVHRSAMIEGKSRKLTFERRLTVMLVMVTTINFALLIPETTAKVLEALGLHQWPWVATFNMMSDVLSYLAHSCNFFFYVLAGKQFRGDLVDLLTCVPCRGKGSSRFNTSSLASSSYKQNTNGMSKY